MYRVLIAEDDEELRALFEHVLKKHSFDVVGVSDGKAAIDAVFNLKFDLVITDIMMPVIDGYELIKQMREANNKTPVLVITAKDAFNDMEKGFASGSDDYMVKPINVNEMVLRANALIRRSQMASERKLTIGGTLLEADLFTATFDNKKIQLPQKEFLILYRLASEMGRIFTRKQLMDEIWGCENAEDTHTVEVHIGRLREKFKDNKDFKIATIRGVGYKVVKL